MGDQNNHWEDEYGQNDRLLFKLALTATDRPHDIGPCLSDQDLVDLVENRIEGSGKEMLIRHLNGCDNCYRQWRDALLCQEMELASDRKGAAVALTSKQRAKVDELVEGLEGKKGWLGYLLATVTSLVKDQKAQGYLFFKKAVPAVAIGLLCVYIIAHNLDDKAWNPQRRSVNDETSWSEAQRPAPPSRQHNNAAIAQTRVDDIFDDLLEIAPRIFPNRFALAQNGKNSLKARRKIVENAKNPWVRMAQSLFYSRTAFAQSEKNSPKTQLEIVENAEKPWVRTLPNGNIQICRHAIEVCYKDVDPATGDARVAYMLGHELGRMAEGDVGQSEDILGSEGGATRESGKLAGAKRLKANRNEALASDDRGFLLAHFATYRMDLLAVNQASSKDFINLWIGQASNDQSDFDPEKRSELLQKRWRQLTEALLFFDYGVRLAHFERYQEALHFFQESQKKFSFRKAFPLREVHNNIGYCYLKMAVKHRYSNSPPPFWWFPSILDINSQMGKSGTKGEDHSQNEDKDAAKELLKKAADAFQRAVKADNTYWPARLNLATALFYQDEFSGARSAIDSAYQLAPEKSRIQIARAIINSYQEPSAGGLPVSLAQLKVLAAKEENLCARYNLAVLYEKNNQKETARQQWNQLASKLDQVPGPLRHSVRLHADVNSDAQETSPAIDSVRQHIWPLAMKPGTDLNHDKAAEAKFAAWPEQINFSRGQVRQSKPDGTEYLKINNIIEIVVVRNGGPKRPADLERRLGRPVVDQSTIGGDLLDYGNASTVRVVGGRIREVWLARQQGES